MSNKARNFLIGIGVAIAFAFVVVGVAIVAYNAGRNSIALPNSAGQEESQNAFVVSVEDGEVTVIPSDSEEQSPSNEAANTEPPEVLQPTRVTESSETATPEHQGDEPTPTPGEVSQPGQDQSNDRSVDQNVDSGQREPVDLDRGDLDLLIDGSVI